MTLQYIVEYTGKTDDRKLQNQYYDLSFTTLNKDTRNKNDSI